MEVSDFPFGRGLRLPSRVHSCLTLTGLREPFVIRNSEISRKPLVTETRRSCLGNQKIVGEIFHLFKKSITTADEGLHSLSAATEILFGFVDRRFIKIRKHLGGARVLERSSGPLTDGKSETSVRFQCPEEL